MICKNHKKTTTNKQTKKRHDCTTDNHYCQGISMDMEWNGEYTHNCVTGAVLQV